MMVRALARGLAALTTVACTAPPGGSSAFMPAPSKPAPELPQKPGDPGWRVLTSVAECDATIAVDPAAQGRARTWRPCASGTAGCSELAPMPGQQDITLEAANTASGVQVVVVESGGERQRISLGPLDGPPFLVLDLKREGGCRFVLALFAASSAALRLSRDAGGDVYFAGPLRADDSWHRPAAREPPGEGFVGPGGSMSLAGRTIVQADPGRGVRRSDPETGRFGPAQPAADARAAFAFGDSIVFASDKAISVSTRPDRAPVLLYEATSGHTLGPLRREGDAFYWVEGSFDQFGKPSSVPDYRELWMANATDDFRAFEARPVAGADVDPHAGRGRHGVGTMRAGGTRVAYRYHPPESEVDKVRVVVKDVITHERRILRLGPEWFGDILFVTAEELGVEIDTVEGKVYRRFRLETLERL